MGSLAWWKLSSEEALSRLNSLPGGLSDEDAARRLEQYGPNELVQTRKISPLKMLLSQFTNLMVIILIIAAVISGSVAIAKGQEGVGEWYDAIMIMIIVFLNAIFGFVQEYKAERAILALKAMAAPKATVLRGGEKKEIPARNLVPGDIVLLKLGDKIPCDCRLIEQLNLKVNESSLTGESIPITKSTLVIDEEVNVGDRRNMVFMGTVVEDGKGKAIAVETGMKTELGKIAGMVQEEIVKSPPLQKKLNRLGKQIGYGIAGACAVIFFVGLFERVDLIQMGLTAISLAVAAVPEGLPAVVTISLALGLQRMLKRHALIRKLPAVETLGSATVICSDKTGTLTRGEMNITTVYTPGREVRVRGKGFEPRGSFFLSDKEIEPLSFPSLRMLLIAGVLCNDAELKESNGRYEILGDTTEGTLLVLGMRAGLRPEELNAEQPRIGEISFTSDRKKMATIHETEKGIFVYVKGAPEAILSISSMIQVNDGERAMTAEDREEILHRNGGMASRSLRVLALAYREMPEKMEIYEEEVVERDLTFLGLVGMIDAPREEAVRAIAECKQAGIDVVMITGDHELTAQSIARQMGLLDEDESGVVTGSQLESMSDEELKRRVEKISVYARVSPAHKIRIVKALQENGHIVAMTGDGVNDAPALKRSDIGVAMGVTGTDVAKESADMILIDDNFASIVDAVEEGRGIYSNIRKFVTFLLSANAGEVLTMFVATLIFVNPIPFLLPLQLLWINLVTDGLPALALGIDPIPSDIMERKPRDPKESPINRYIFVMVIGVGLLICVGTLGLFALESQLFGVSVEKARTIAFTTLVMFQLFFVFSVRSSTLPLYKVGLWSNSKLVIAVLISFLLQVMIIYLPPLQIVFRTEFLGPLDWLKIVLVAISAFVVVELVKITRLRKGAKAVKDAF